jgi:hypothetical protein
MFCSLIGSHAALHVFRVCTQLLTAAQYIRSTISEVLFFRMSCMDIPGWPADDTSTWLIGNPLDVGPHVST